MLSGKRQKSLTLLLALALATSSAAEDVPAELGLVVMLKVLTYDVRFDARGSGDFLVLVPYTSRASADDFLATTSKVANAKVKTRVLKLHLVDVAALADTAKALKPAAILVMPDSPAPVLAAAIKVAKAEQLYTLAFGEAPVQGGAFLGVAPHDGKPQVLLNATTAKAIGAELPNNVLRIARVFQ